jgi:hypothetical protein
MVLVKTVPEFIAYAKARPGKINMATDGLGARRRFTATCSRRLAANRARDATSRNCIRRLKIAILLLPGDGRIVERGLRPRVRLRRRTGDKIGMMCLLCIRH